MSAAPRRLSPGQRAYLSSLGQSAASRGSRSTTYDATRVKQRAVSLPVVPFLEEKEPTA